MGWIAGITPVGTLCFFSKDTKKAAMEAFVFGRWCWLNCTPHKFSRIYLNNFWLRSAAIVPVAKVALEGVRLQWW
jgi:hypothetical protein